MDIVTEFFKQQYEKKINKDILFYSFSEDEMKRYILQSIEEPVEHYLAYMDQIKEKEEILSCDIVQFSKLDDATYNICCKMMRLNNPGMKFFEIGRLLLDDGIERGKDAYIKYGENHVKTAEILGLTFELCHSYYLSGVGYIYSSLSEENQERLLVRLILRSKLIKRMYQASRNGRVNMREFLYMLSDSTYIRRRSNIKKVLNILYNSKEYDFKMLDSLIKF